MGTAGDVLNAQYPEFCAVFERMTTPDFDPLTLGEELPRLFVVLDAINGAPNTQFRDVEAATFVACIFGIWLGQRGLARLPVIEKETAE